MAELQQTLATLLGGETGTQVEMRLVKKYGRPFLLLPAKSQLAAQTLALYPAQTPPARLARHGLRAALTVGLSVGTERLSVAVSPTNSFVRFLCETANRDAKDSNNGADIPPFGILIGNPNAVGQRLVFLIFDATGKPVAVIKVGVTGEAKKLIRQEKDFLSEVSGISGIPRLRNTFESSTAEALVMDFFEGDSPRENAEWKVPQLVTSWIRSDVSIPILETRVWSELKQRCPTLPLFVELDTRLSKETVKPVVFHGDLTPWNIKASTDGQWTVFDWERGDLNGLPGYDWFHYFIQTRILVAHKPPQALIEELDHLILSSEFQKYAALTNISGIERPLAMLYLLHHNEVIVPGEGLKEGTTLLDWMAARNWAR